MKIVTKRIVSLLVSLFLLVSSMSVGFTAFAAEETGTETIVNGDTEIGTAGEAVEEYNMEVGSLNQKEINQTEVDPENNYSIPARLNESNSNYRPRHVYYRTTAPMNMGDTDNGKGWGILWDNNTNNNADFKGSDSDASTRYSDCYTKIFYDFGDIYEINEVIWGNNNTLDYRASDITFYAGNDFVTLFSEENKIGYLEGAEVAVSIKTTGLKARYVAAKVGTMCQKVWNDGYLRLTEFNVLGKYSEKAQIGETTMHTSIDAAGAAVNGLTSLVATSPTIYTKINDTVKNDNKQYAGLYDGELNGSESSNGHTHTIDGKYVEGKDVYTSFTYDLGAVKNVTKVLVAHGISSGYHYQTGLFDIYVSEDEGIDETDLVAQVNDLGSPNAYKNPAHTVDLGEGKAGRYVELRIYAPARGFGNPLPSYFYWRLQEFNVYGNDHCSHTEVIDAAVAPTCTATGLTEGKHCSKCNAVLVAQKEVAALGHDVIIVGKIDPTETTPGYTGDEVCQRCDTTLQVGSQIPTIVIDFTNCVSLEGQINCINNDIKVLFQIPNGKSDIRGMQLSFNIPQGFTLDNVSTPLTGWSIYSKPETGFVILTCGNNMSTLEEVAQPNEFNKYHVLTLKLIPDESVATGQKQTTVTVQDVTTGYDSNINSTPTNITFDYVKGHTAGEVVVENEVAADCLNNGSYNNVVYCTVCNAELSRDTITVDALGHNWQINTEDEVKYCCANNNCDVEAYIVKFYGRSERLLYETAVEIGEGGVGYLSDADIAAANAAAPCIYGYNYIGWDIELTTETPIIESQLIFAVYERKTERYNTILEDSEGKTIDTKEIEFDQRFVVESDTAKSFLVDGQVVGGEEGVVLYGLGSELVVKTSENVAPKEISVAILKAEAELINDKYVYRVFVHVYNPLDAEISQIGVIFAPESVYTNDENFKIETLNKDKCKILSTELETSDVLATFTGIKPGTTRIVRGYAVSNGTNTYSKAVVKHKFN